MIHYTITPFDLHQHRFQVEIECEALEDQTLSLPSWIPGSYMIRDFAKHILQLEIKDCDSDEPVVFQQINKHQYKLNTKKNQEICIRYQVYAWDHSVRSAFLDQTAGFFNGSSVFFQVKGQEKVPCKMTLHFDDHKAICEHWQVATTMPRTKGKTFQAGTFEADNYEALIDYPVLMGTLSIFPFESCGVPHHLVLCGRHFADGERICQDLKKICDTEIKFFHGQDPAPYEQYQFLTLVQDQGYGGLEHRDSTMLMCSRTDLPSQGDSETNKDYIKFLGLCAHEYFHNWNVKRLKPVGFLPYQLDQETYTDQLWAYEGITSYYDDWMLLRSGLISRSTYLKCIAQNFTRVMRGHGRFEQTLRASSYNAWTKFYQQDANAANAIVSYYAKGALFALFLDLSLRHKSQHKITLDKVMQSLWKSHGVNGQGTMSSTHQDVCEHLTGMKLNDVFAYLDSTDDLPLTPLLQEFGIRLVTRPKQGFQDQGGSTQHEDMAQWVDLGIQGTCHADGMHIQVVHYGSIAATAGLSAGDKLIAFDGYQVNTGFEKLLRHYEADQKVKLYWFRRDQLMSATAKLDVAPRTTYHLEVENDEKASLWLKV